MGNTAKEPQRRLHILMIGPLPPPVGGATMSFEQMVRALKSWDRLNVSVIARWPSTKGTLRKLLSALNVSISTLLVARNADVIALFASSGGIVRWSPFLHLVARCCRKPWILRAFGGGLDLAYTGLPAWKKAWIRGTSLSADLVMFQTRALVGHFAAISLRDNVVWHSNSRPWDPRALPPARHKCRRFVYVGHVKPAKGIREILRASELLPQDLEIHIFGPLLDGMQETDLDRCEKVTYCGTLAPGEVVPALRRYDALLLPTYYEGEGYPGVVLEAYSVGMPVIASRWRAIPEIVDDTCGILVNPKDPYDLASAIDCLVEDGQLYRQLCQGAWKKREDFSLEVWAGRFIEYCEAAVSREAPRREDLV